MQHRALNNLEHDITKKTGVKRYDAAQILFAIKRDERCVRRRATSQREKAANHVRGCILKVPMSQMNVTP